MGEELEADGAVDNNTITPEKSPYCDSSKRLEYVKKRAKNIITYYKQFMLGLGADVAFFKKGAGYKEFIPKMIIQTGTDYLPRLKHLMDRNSELQSCTSSLKTQPTKSTTRPNMARMGCIHELFYANYICHLPSQRC